MKPILSVTEKRGSGGSSRILKREELGNNDLEALITCWSYHKKLQFTPEEIDKLVQEIGFIHSSIEIESCLHEENQRIFRISLEDLNKIKKDFDEEESQPVQA